MTEDLKQLIEQYAHLLDTATPEQAFEMGYMLGLDAGKADEMRYRQKVAQTAARDEIAA